MNDFLAKQSQACRFCRHYESRIEMQHLGLGHCRRMQITVVAMSPACESFAPQLRVMEGLDILCGFKGHWELCIYVLANSSDAALAHVLGTSQTPCSVCMEHVRSLGCSLLIVARGREVVQYASLFMDRLTLSDEFWTCDCHGDCIRHESMRPCPLCGGQAHTGRCRTLQEALRSEQARQNGRADTA